jgi:hypothetical protein
MNPLHLEYKRARLSSLVLIVLLALCAATIDYFWGLQQRLSQRQALLFSATEDLEHQLSPLIALLKLVQQDAGQQLAIANSVDAQDDTKVDAAKNEPVPVPLPGLQWSLSTSEQQLLRPEEVAMLQRLQPLMLLSQRTVSGVQQLSYLSAQGIWYQPQAQTQAAAEQFARQYWRQYQQHLTQNAQQQLTRPLISLKKITTSSASYVLTIGIFRQREFLGELLLEFDLPALLQKTAKAQLGSQLRLFDEGGELLLAVAHGEVLAARADDLSMHHGEQLKMLSQLPLSLHMTADRHHTFTTELMNFLVHFFLFLAGLLVLLMYCRRRFRTKVLSPFQRLLVHMERIVRGDAQGVRNVPTDWQSIFRQVDQLKSSQFAENPSTIVINDRTTSQRTETNG